MKRTIARILIGATLLWLVSTVAVTIIGLLLGWETSSQFSDGLFWAGAVMILIGFVSLRGYGYRTTSWPRVDVAAGDSTGLAAADISRGKMLMAVCGICGLLLIGSSMLVLRLF